MSNELPDDWAGYLAHSDQLDATIDEMLRPLVRGLLALDNKTDIATAGVLGDAVGTTMAPILLNKTHEELVELVFTAVARLAVMSVNAFLESGDKK